MEIGGMPGWMRDDDGLRGEGGADVHGIGQTDA